MKKGLYRGKPPRVSKAEEEVGEPRAVEKWDGIAVLVVHIL